MIMAQYIKRRSEFIAVALLITYGFPPCSGNPQGSSDVSESYNTGEVSNGCDSTSCSTTTPSTHSKFEKASFGIYFSNNSLLNASRDLTLDDIRSSEFRLLHNIISGIMKKITGVTNVETNSSSDSTDFTSPTNDMDISTSAVQYSTNSSNSSTVTPPALFKSLKIFVPPLFSELLGRLTEIYDRDLPEDDIKEKESSSESTGFLDSLKQNMLDLVQDKPKHIESVSYNATTDSSSDLKSELDGLLKKVKKEFQNELAGKDKVDKLCEIIEKHVDSRILLFKNVSSSTSDKEGSSNRTIVKTLKKTIDVVCSDDNKKLLKKLADSQKGWANKITTRVLARAIDRISKRKTSLRYILNLIMGTILETPTRS